MTQPVAQCRLPAPPRHHELRAPAAPIRAKVTLVAAPTGDSNIVLDQLMPVVYGDLLRLARNRFASETAGHLLEPAALVNEVYLRLRRQRTHWQNRDQLIAIAARLMRRVLVDYARRARAIKRVTVPPEPEQRFVPAPSVDRLTLEQALGRLGTRAPRQYNVVRLRHLGGLTVNETATALGVSPATVKLDWRLARDWLATQIMPD